MLNGCSKPILKMPKPLPSIVKQYKHITLWSTRPGMKNTGIYINERELYSILATGSIDIWPSGPKYHDVRPEHGWPLMVRIGEKNWFFEPFRGRKAFTAHSNNSGYLYLGIRDGKKVDKYGNPLDPKSYEDNIGSFSADVIVWKSEDYVQISDFFENMKEKDPTNKAVIFAFEQARWQQKLLLASTKTSDEIEKTKKEIQKLKEEDELEAYDAMTQKEMHLASLEESKEIEGKRKKIPELNQQPEKGTERPTKIAPEVKRTPPPKPTTVDMKKQERVAQLEAKLTKLTETLAQLEEMKEKFEEERKRTDLLTRELEEKETREKELLGRLEQAEKTPPVIVVAAPRDGIEVEVGTITFSGVAEDDQGLKGLDIFINNNPLLTKVNRDIKVVGTKPLRRLEFAERVPLQRGKNEIRIRAIDTDNLAAEKTLTVRYRETRKNVWGAVIGIDKYQNIRHLKYAVKDARAFYHHLIRNNRIPEENVTLMVNEQARLNRVRSILGTHLKNKVGKEDMVIIYFAGHGACEKDVMSPDKDGLEKYILPYDADPKDLYASALPMREISHIFHRIHSERLIFIADACYSGASGGRTISLTGVRANISDAFLDRIAGGKGRVILTASGPNEVSGEDEKLQHGVFTYFLLEGLRGEADTDGDGMITVDEVYRYVSREVPRATGQEQHPVKKGIVEGQLILGVID